MDSKELEKLGLNKNEALVYYGLLKLGSSTASDLVKKIGVHRNIVYDNLEKLIEKGLVSYIIKENKKLFIAQDSSSIIEFLDKKIEEVEKEKIIAKDLIKDIEKLRNKDSLNQEAQIFRGIKGMKKVLAEILEAKENLVLGMTNKSTELLGETYWKNYNIKVKDRKIKEKMLLNSDFEDIYSFEKNKNTKIRILPEELNQVIEIILFDNKVAIFIYSDSPMVFLIQDKDLFKTYLQQFEFFWKLSDDLNK